MKRFLTFVLLVFAVLNAISGWKGGSVADRNLIRTGKALGLDLSGGTLLHFEDSHGGFHNDGLTSAEIELDGLAEELTDAPGWRSLPMSGNAAQALSMCGVEGTTVSQGYYYLYDRHSESCDPYDDAELCGRYSWNFTMAVYDSGNGRLYFYALDT